MATQSIQLLLTNGEGTQKTVPLKPGTKGAQERIKAIPDGKYILTDKESGIAPKKVTVHRAGKNLLLYLEGDTPDDPTLIIEDFFAHHSELIGTTEDGGYYAYATSEDDDRAAIWLLQDGETASWTLGASVADEYGLQKIIDNVGDFTRLTTQIGVTNDGTPTFNGVGNVGGTVIIKKGVV